MMCIVPGSFGSPIPRIKRYRMSPGTCARVSCAATLRRRFIGGVCVPRLIIAYLLPSRTVSAPPTCATYMSKSLLVSLRDAS